MHRSGSVPMSSSSRLLSRLASWRRQLSSDFVPKARPTAPAGLRIPRSSPSASSAGESLPPPPARTIEVQMSLYELMQEKYSAAKQYAQFRSKRPRTDYRNWTTLIFTNTEMSLQDIDVYGFDYDFTLANYNDNVAAFMFESAKRHLVQRYNYPRNIMHFLYNPSFAARGMHFDIKRGLFLKTDAVHNIQPGTVYRGLRPLSSDQVAKIYKGTRIPDSYLKEYGDSEYMVQLYDSFAAPEMNLLAYLIEYLEMRNIQFDPMQLHADVRASMEQLHQSGKLHDEIVRDPERYLRRDSRLEPLLSRLQRNGKKVFLVSNSNYNFIDGGLTYLLGKDWRQYFDLVVVQARKPLFFTSTSKPFRHLCTIGGQPSWHSVESLEPHSVYSEGNVTALHQLTQWKGERTLFCGDHVSSDLLDASLQHGWRTGAVIPELAQELRSMSSDRYRENVYWLDQLERLISEMQERRNLLEDISGMTNIYFGSIFRTHNHVSFFCRRLARYADVYMSSITNLLNYKLTHTFYPPRVKLPHEQVL
uniref:5'-nucleotidase domain-containing protein 3 n=1 Tax=Macrostomum lignano TaxID=282301 RepID=A0A1I8HYM0_9PLAT